MDISDFTLDYSLLWQLLLNMPVWKKMLYAPCLLCLACHCTCTLYSCDPSCNSQSVNFPNALNKVGGYMRDYILLPILGSIVPGPTISNVMTINYLWILQYFYPATNNQRSLRVGWLVLYVLLIEDCTLLIHLFFCWLASTTKENILWWGMKDALIYWHSYNC